MTSGNRSTSSAQAADDARFPLSRGVAVLLLCLCANFVALHLAGWHVAAAFSPWSDLETYFRPKYAYAAERIAAGKLPLWNPLEFCGIPFLATIQPGVFYLPLRVVYGLFTDERAYFTFFLLHLILGACFSTILLRSVGCGMWACILGAMWVSQPTWLIRVYDHPVYFSAIIWVPLLLFLVRELLRTPSLRLAALLGAVSALQVLSGYPLFAVATGYVLVLSVPVWIVGHRGDASLVRAFAAFAIALVIALLLTAVQVLPAAELLAHGTRASDVDTMQAGMGRIPDSFRYLIGIPEDTVLQALVRMWRDFGPVLIVPALLAVLVRPDAAASCFLGEVVLTGVLPRSWIRWLPFSDFDRFSLEWRLMATPMLYALAAIGWSRVSKRLSLRPGVMAVSTMAMLAAMSVWNWTNVDPNWLRPLYPEPLQLDASIARGCDLHPGGSRVFSPSAQFYGRVLAARLESPSGYEQALLPARTAALLAPLGLGNGAALFDWPQRITAHLGTLSRMAVKCLITWAPVPALAQAGLEATRPNPKGIVVYENPQAVPRVRVVFGARRVASEQEALEALLTGPFDPSTVVLEGDASGVVPLACDQPGRATLTSYAAEEVVADVTTQCPGYLVLADAYAPGWVATVDGNPATIVVADYLFRAVAVAPGHHRVVFRYAPRSVWIGSLLSVVGLGIGLAAACVAARRDPFRQTDSPSRHTG